MGANSPRRLPGGRVVSSSKEMQLRPERDVLRGVHSIGGTMTPVLAVLGKASRGERLFDLTVFGAITAGYIALAASLAAALTPAGQTGSPSQEPAEQLRSTPEMRVCKCKSAEAADPADFEIPGDPVHWT